MRTQRKELAWPTCLCVYLQSKAVRTTVSRTDVSEQVTNFWVDVLQHDATLGYVHD